eukprot:GHVS01095253.1.p1 GENE.GHVS01095253.1~~GHVS01095253.1.p1  ORF type:complete len:147 (-),score=30.25 GHVS01095253.1:2-442(-)
MLLLLLFWSGHVVAAVVLCEFTDEANRAKQPKTQEELLEEFRRREREKALATGKDYARRPTSYKSSLSLKIEMGTTRRKSRSASPVAVAATSSASASRGEARSPETKRTAQPSVEHKQKMAQLMQKYKHIHAHRMSVCCYGKHCQH